MDEERCTQEQVCELEEIYDEIWLDDLQRRIHEAVGPYWSGDIKSKIASLDCDIRETIRQMEAEVNHE